MKIPISRALIFIFLSVIVISGPAFLGLLYYQSLMEARSESEHYVVRSLIHANPKLETAYLAHLLSLPANLYTLNRQEMEEKLLSSPLIKRAKVKKILPNKLLLDYSVRKPIARLADFENVLIDSLGYPFPDKPFFTNEDLPSLFLGEVSCEWNKPIDTEAFHTALKLYRLIEKKLISIDVSKMSQQSAGRREIIVILDEGKGKTYLRLSDNFLQELAHYKVITENLPMEGDRVIDLRFDQMGLLQKLYTHTAS